MDGLTHPRDLEAWHRWHHGAQPLTRRVRRTLDVLRDIARPDGRAGEVVLTRGGPRCRVLVLVEARTPSQLHALVAPLRDLPLDDVVVVSPVPVRDALPPWLWQESRTLAHEEVPELASGAEVVLSTGHFLGLGRLGRDAVTDPARFVTVQHGLLTPHAPPLAEGTTLLAWSDADAEFWRSGRDDVTTQVVGSQLLWEAGLDRLAAAGRRTRARSSSASSTASSSRASSVTRGGRSFCRAEGAVYRPHPAETRPGHARPHERWQPRASPSTGRARPLRELGAPVVSVFSTGVARGRCRGAAGVGRLPRRPAVAREFWDRYDMRPLGRRPDGTAPHAPMEPSRAVAVARRG